MQIRGSKNFNSGFAYFMETASTAGSKTSSSESSDERTSSSASPVIVVIRLLASDYSMSAIAAGIYNVLGLYSITVRYQFRTTALELMFTTFRATGTCTYCQYADHSRYRNKT